MINNIPEEWIVIMAAVGELNLLSESVCAALSCSRSLTVSISLYTSFCFPASVTLTRTRYFGVGNTLAMLAISSNMYMYLCHNMYDNMYLCHTAGRDANRTRVCDMIYRATDLDAPALARNVFDPA